MPGPRSSSPLDQSDEKADRLGRREGIIREHPEWEANLVIGAAKAHVPSFTHGVAAKLINIYLKSRFVCGGHHEHERVCQLHPPIDDELLKALIQRNVGGQVKRWREARRWRWSKFTSDRYEQVISLIRHSLNGRPFWQIEEHWKGNQ